MNLPRFFALLAVLFSTACLSTHERITSFDDRIGGCRVQYDPQLSPILVTIETPVIDRFQRAVFDRVVSKVCSPLGGGYTTWALTVDRRFVFRTGPLAEGTKIKEQEEKLNDIYYQYVDEVHRSRWESRTTSMTCVCQDGLMPQPPPPSD